MKTWQTVALVFGGVVVYGIYKASQTASSVANSLSPTNFLNNLSQDVSNGWAAIVNAVTQPGITGNPVLSTAGPAGASPTSIANGVGNAIVNTGVVDKLYYDTGVGAIVDYFNNSPDNTAPSASTYSNGGLPAGESNAGL